MSAPERRPGNGPDVERLVREALPDDLPPEVEERLERRLRAFLFVQRSGREQATARGAGLAPVVRWAPARIALAAAATLAIVSGLSLQAAVAPDAADEALRRISLSVSLFRSLRDASSLRCAGMADEALVSPGSLADHVYRLWIPLGARRGASGTVVGAYATAERDAVYELVLEDGSTLPREIVRRDARAGVVRATCDWVRPAPAGADEPR